MNSRIKTSPERILKYSEAIAEGLSQTMDTDESVFLVGQGVDNPWYVGQTVQGIFDRFGASRVVDPPVSEQAMNGAAIGAALAGMKPVVLHPRMDFLIVGLEQIVNEAANWRYMTDGAMGVPIVFRAIINRGGEQAAQHSQALHAFFAHVPGIKVVMPATANDAKGLLIAAINDPDPVLYIDDRWLYEESEHVPEESYETPIGKAAIRKSGNDVSIIATSVMVREALVAEKQLQSDGISAEVIDLRTISPLDRGAIKESAKKTGRVVIADAAWRTAGIAAEVSTIVVEESFNELHSPPVRVCLPDTPAPASSSLENAYYPTSTDIVCAVHKLMDQVDAD